MLKFKRWIGLCFLLFIPIIFFLNTWQSFRYASLKKEIRKLENEQIELIEENKRKIVALSILNFPARIRAIAEMTLGLKQPPVHTYIEIHPSLEGKNTDG
ncbi:MAG: hypothetical protein SNJ78_10345 [Spirochaetales bacterium]